MDYSADTSSVPGDYWAARAKEELVQDLCARVKAHYQSMGDRGLTERIRESYRRYYGLTQTGTFGSPASRSGDRGEVVHLSANHYRNLLSHIMVLVTNQRPTIQARPINMDPKSLAQAVSAQGILEYFWREKRLERRYRKAVEVSLVCGAGYLHQTWDETRGEAYDVDLTTGQVAAEGDVVVDVLSPLDVVMPLAQDWEDIDWVVVRLRRNRHTLAAKYPEYADELQVSNTWLDHGRHTLQDRSPTQRIEDRDLCYEFVFYHRPTPALPMGRVTHFTGPTGCLQDGDLPYERVPVFRVAPGEVMDSSLGYTGAWDLLALQEAADTVLSALVSSVDALGHQRVFYEKGSIAGVDELLGGITAIGLDPGTRILPQGVNLAAMPQDGMALLDYVVKNMETLSGINSVARGDPQASLKSGSALALVQTMAVQFMNGLQESYAHLVEDGQTNLVNIIKAFAKTPRMVMIAGNDQRPLLAQWSGADLDRINRVVVDVSNALSQTMSGRFEQAQWLKDLQATAQPGADVQQSFAKVVQVATTGRLEPQIDGPRLELVLIQDENQRLMEGVRVEEVVDPMTGIVRLTTPDVPVLPTDNDVIHIQAHSTKLLSVEVRNDPDVLEGVMAHILWHADNMRSRDPMLSEVLGLPAVAPPVLPGEMAPGPEGAPGSVKTPAGAPEAPAMPKMPKNPMTGSRVDPGGRPPSAKE